MPEQENIRVDKFLWAVRIYKTRSMASEACRRGRIIINNTPVKPSRIISGNEIIAVKKPPVTHTYRILEPIQNRISAKLVTRYIEDLTTEEEKAKSSFTKSVIFGFRPRGYGRPTKKERRSIDRLNEEMTNH
jgi:ribosome-associated heat shock protein Hsp15